MEKFDAVRIAHITDYGISPNEKYDNLVEELKCYNYSYYFRVCDYSYIRKDKSKN